MAAPWDKRTNGEGWDEFVGPPGQKMRMSTWYQVVKSGKGIGSEIEVTDDKGKFHRIVRPPAPPEYYEKIDALLAKGGEPATVPLASGKQPMLAAGSKRKPRKDPEHRVPEELKKFDREDREDALKAAKQRRRKEAEHDEEVAQQFLAQALRGGRRPKQAAIDFILHHARDNDSHSKAAAKGTFRRFGVTFIGNDDAAKHRDLETSLATRARQLADTHGLPEGVDADEVAFALAYGQAKPAALKGRAQELDAQAEREARELSRQKASVDKLRKSYSKVLPTRWGYLEKQDPAKLYQAYESSVKKREEQGIPIKGKSVERLTGLKEKLGRGASKDTLIAAILENEVALKQAQDEKDARKQLQADRVRDLQNKEARRNKVPATGEPVPGKGVGRRGAFIAADAVLAAQGARDNLRINYGRGRQAWLDLKAVLSSNYGLYGTGSKRTTGAKLKESLPGLTFLGRIILKIPAALPVFLAVSAFLAIAGFAWMVAASEDTGPGLLTYGEHGAASVGAVLWNALMVLLNAIISGVTVLIKIFIGFWLTLTEAIYNLLFAPLIDGVNKLVSHTGIGGELATWEIDPASVKGPTILHISYIEPAFGTGECNGQTKLFGIYNTIPVEGTDGESCPPYLVFNPIVNETNRPIELTKEGQKFSVLDVLKSWGESWLYVGGRAVEAIV